MGKAPLSAHDGADFASPAVHPPGVEIFRAGLAQREQLNGVYRLLRLKRRQASEAQVEARTARD
jgi:hypothetical protein